MDSATFLAESKRTVADGRRHFDAFDPALLKGAVLDTIRLARRLDLLKKSLYYGKPFDAEAAGFAPAADAPFETAALDADLLHAVIGLITEAGEMLEALVTAAGGAPLDKVNLAEEVGDAEWYLAIVYRFLDAMPEDVKAVNIRKLRARYPEKFTSDRAITRDLETERKILEGKM